MAAVPARSLRAITEYMRVVEEAPDLYTVVGESGAAYTVDLRDGPACTCPDFQYREEVVACKHVRRARLVAGEADVTSVREHLAATADEADSEADRLAGRAAELRTTADHLRSAIERLDELVAGEPPGDGSAGATATDDT